MGVKQKLINKFEKYIKRFPTDCKGCKEFICYDMSVDDWTHICKVDRRQIDLCDLSFYKRVMGNPRGSICPKFKLKFIK